MTILRTAAFLDVSSLDRDDLDFTGLERAVASWQWFDRIEPVRLEQLIGDVDVIVTNKVEICRQHFEQAVKLKLVCITATGTNNVDLVAAHEHDVAVCNVTAYATASVVQHVFMLLLNLTIRYDEYRDAVRQGGWSRSRHFCMLDYPLRELNGKTLGIVGYGELGRSTAGIARAFGMNILIAKRDDRDDRPGRKSLDDMLPLVDVLSLHCPLTQQTRGLIGRKQLALMKNDAVLINTARGGLVDEEALVEALQGGLLGGAGIDVIEKEPPPVDYPLLQSHLPNLIVTPHIAWASRESRQRLVNEIVSNIQAFSEGRERNRV